jgi:NRAMP (natural resistance-associated macrophage protein)-like metal ion transporter
LPTKPGAGADDEPTVAQEGHKSSVHQFFADLGPGLITGAADDDPSGISTYSVAGASFGYAPLWTVLLSFPLMSAVQLMCARLAMVTGRGLAGVVRRRYPRWILWSSCAVLVVANVINIAADLGGMGEVTQMVTGVSAFVWTPFYACSITALLFWLSYHRIAKIFKWLTLALFAYVFTAFLAHADWGLALRSTFVPHIEWSRDSFSVLVAILGTTISPYLFFWQAAQEVEEERARGLTLAQRRGATDQELRNCRTDVVTGMFFSNFVMYFIIMTTAATLHAHGKTNIATAREAAEALRPLAGDGAYWLFTLGLLGTGMLGVPVLVGSCAYAVSEGSAWRGSLEQKPHSAKKFYTVMGLAMLLGLALNYVGLNAIKMLFLAAVVNGLLAPPLILLVVLLTSDPTVMGERVNSASLRYLGWATFFVMVLAAVGLLVTV